MRVGILTGGGDCPGLNAVIRAVVRKAERHYGDEVIGFRDGWRGVVEDVWTPLDVESCRGLLPRGGTVLGTSRHTPFNLPDGMARATETLRALAVDALIAVGGEGTLSCACEISDRGFDVVGVPKTIDNDVAMTERTFGFDTAVTVATEAIDRLHTTAESHDRVIFVEVMGRNVGHIATWAGIAGGASYILVPEEPFDLDDLCAALLRRQARGPLRLDSGGGRGRQAQARHHGGGRAPDRRLRAQTPRRDRDRHSGRGRGPHRPRDPSHDPGPCPAGRLAHGVGPGAGHPIRGGGHRRGA